MIITLSLKDLNSKIQSLYLQDRLHNFSIDYHPNKLYAVDWTLNEEVEVFDFNRIFKMDNRWTSYKIHTGRTEINIEIIFN